MDNVMKFGYRGTVKLNLNVGGKFIGIKTYNSGTEALSRTFAKFMSGYGEISNDIPRYLDLRVATGPAGSEWSSSVTCLTQPIPLSGRKYFYDETIPNWVAEYTATINFDRLSKTIVANTPELFRIYLCSVVGGVTTDYAYIDVAASDLAKISSGIEAIIQWVLELINYVGE